MPEAETSERIVQRSGREWRVREVAARTVPGSQGPRCLICESTDVVRRLWEYPHDWRDLEDDALYELCERPVFKPESDGR